MKMSRRSTIRWEQAATHRDNRITTKNPQQARNPIIAKEVIVNSSKINTEATNLEKIGIITILDNNLCMVSTASNRKNILEISLSKLRKKRWKDNLERRCAMQWIKISTKLYVDTMKKPRKGTQIWEDDMSRKREDARKRSTSSIEDTEMRLIMTKVRRWSNNSTKWQTASQVMSKKLWKWDKN